MPLNFTPIFGFAFDTACWLNSIIIIRKAGGRREERKGKGEREEKEQEENRNW